MAWLLAQLWETKFVAMLGKPLGLGKEGVYVRQKKSFDSTAIAAVYCRYGDTDRSMSRRGVL